MNYKTLPISVLLVLLCINFVMAQSNQFCPLQINAPGILLFNPAFSGLLCEYDANGTLQNTSKSTPLLSKELNHFEAISTTNTDVVLKWAIKHQKTKPIFEVLRSTDRRSFQRIGIVRTSDEVNGKSFTYLDKNPVQGNNFYFIRLVGTKRILSSAVQKVYIQHQKPFFMNSEFTLSGNELHLSYHTNQSANYTLNISDETADVLVFKEVALAAGKNQFKFCIPNPGKHYILLYNHDHFFTEIFIKKTKNKNKETKEAYLMGGL